jgi:hypothetical protein
MTVPLHPALVHVPLGLAFVLPLLSAALAAFALLRGSVPRRAWAVALALQAVVVVAGLAARSAGERDEKPVAQLTGRAAVEAHEAAADAFLWGAALALAVSAAALAMPRRAGAVAAAVACAATVAVAGLGYRAGKAGGELVYPRGGAAAYSPVPPSGPSRPSVVSRSEHHHR